MFRSKLIPVVIAAVMTAGGSGAAYAAVNGKGEDAREVQAVLSAKVTAAQAIAAAEQKTGGHAIKISFEDEKAGPLFEVKTITRDKLVEVFIDPATGNVVRTEDEGRIERMFDQDDKAELAKLSKSPTSLTAAIAAAEQDTGGKAFNAAREDEDGQANFEVEVIKDKVVHEVKVDVATGKVMTVSAGEGHDEHED
jgi:uncharacterized membrane protein YkoI